MCSPSCAHLHRGLGVAILPCSPPPAQGTTGRPCGSPRSPGTPPAAGWKSEVLGVEEERSRPPSPAQLVLVLVLVLLMLVLVQVVVGKWVGGIGVALAKVSGSA